MGHMCMCKCIHCLYVCVYAYVYVSLPPCGCGGGWKDKGVGGWGVGGVTRHIIWGGPQTRDKGPHIHTQIYIYIAIYTGVALNPWFFDKTPWLMLNIAINTRIFGQARHADGLEDAVVAWSAVATGAPHVTSQGAQATFEQLHMSGVVVGFWTR